MRNIYLKIKKLLFGVRIIPLLVSVVLVVLGSLWAIYNYRPSSIAQFSGDSPIIGASDKFVPVKYEGWGKGWFTSPEYDGADMPDNSLVEATNIDFNVKNSIAPRLGSIILGTESTDLYSVQSLYTAHTWDGRELLLRTSSTTIEWWNTVDSNWDVLDSGYTANQVFNFTEGTTSSEDWNYVYFANGIDSLYRFRTAFGTVASNTTTTITLNAVSSFDSADDIGFASTGGTLTVAGNDYIYTGLMGWQLTGLSGVPTLTANDGVIEAATSTGFTDAPTSASDLVIKDQRLYASYQNSVYASKIDSFMDFSYSAPRVASEGELVIFPEGGSKITGLAARQLYVAVFKQNYIGSLEFRDFGASLSDIPVISTITYATNNGVTDSRAITQKDYSVMFVNSDIGLTELTQLENKNYDQSVSLSERLRLTFEDYDFNKSAIVSFNNKTLISARSDTSISFNNVVIQYDYLYDRFTLFSGWNVSSWAIFDNKLYYGDSLTQNVYQAFYTNYSDNDLPITTSVKTKWYNFGEAARLKEIGSVFVEGFITQNTSLIFKINFDEGGALATKSVTIVGTGDYVASLPAAGFGINPFGLSDFGTTSDEDALRHFSGYINLQGVYDKKFRNIQFEISTSGVGQNYRISKIYPYVSLLEESYNRANSKFIIND